ncbi:MAG: hypothetical protein IJC66_03590 [Kiritimatiellae bacterium]|nr:hypothetical protein [Kiritimatiellia bacterium]
MIRRSRMRFEMVRRFVCLFVAALGIVSMCAAEVYDVRAFGAKGDGVTKDTASIQKALDACAGKGGRVVFPRGTYLSGSIYVGNDTELHFQEGAVLLGSPDLNDYNGDNAYPQNHGSIREGWSAKHLILVLEKKNVKITGKGVIDGNGRAFFDEKIAHRHKSGWRHGGRNAKGKRAEQRRPGQEIVFIECADVEVRNVTFKDMSCWSCLFHGCENVIVGGVTVRNGFLNLNTDAFDIDSCRNVSIGDCDVITGDDAVAIRGNPHRLKDPSKVCENIRVSNIVCKVQASAVRVGVGNGTIRNVHISDMKIKEAGTGLNVQCCYGNPKGEGKLGVDISDIAFERIEIDDVCSPVTVTAGSPASSAILKNIEFREIKSKSQLPPSIIGMGKTRPCNIAFRDCSFTVGCPISGAKPEDSFDLSEGGGKGAFVIRDVDGLSFKNTVVGLYSTVNAVAAVDCLKNGSFEMREKAAEGTWKLPKGWRFERGFGRNGSGGLVFESSERTTKATWAQQIIDIKPGAVYNLTAWIEGKLDSPKGLFAVAHFLDEKGKMVGSARTISHGANRKWGMVTARTKRLPANARKVRICLYVPDGALGQAFFDDVTFIPFKVEPVTALCTACYRNEVVAGDPSIKFFAGIDLNDSNCTKENSKVVFSFDAADGRRVKRNVPVPDGDAVSVEIDPKELKLGEQEIAAEIIRNDGIVAGRRTLKITKFEKRPERPVWIDNNRRVIVNGKPFFPIAVYCSRAESNIVEVVGKSPFNTLMAYSRFDWAMLDWCKEHGLMASLHAGDLSCTDSGIGRMVNRLKDHPAILTWLMNDERPLSMLSQLYSRYRAIRENDDGHPTWAVLYQVDDMRGYVGTCDAIGSDPYPIPHASVKLAHDWAEKTRNATFGAMSMWQTVQIFDWAAYKTKAVPGTDVSKYRAPTLAEMKIMTWFQIASGANALFMYSYNPLVKMDWRDPFEKKWAEVCECVGEVAAVSDVILSVEKAPVLKNVPSGLSVRTWRKDGNVHLLVCNASGKSLKRKLPLSVEFSGKMRTVFGGGAVREGDSLSLDFPLEGYAFLTFDR